MPSYDYRCPANDRVLEVRHGMNDAVSTWGELCQRAGIELGDTPADAPVERIYMPGGVAAVGGGKTAEAPSCGLHRCGAGCSMH